MIERLVELALRNRLMVCVLAVLVMAAGYWSYRELPVDAIPDVSPNLVQVFTVTEGLGPEEVEKFVTAPVEISMTGLPGVVELRSVSNFGLSVVNIYFEDGLDIYFCRQLVGERLGAAREQIPPGFGEPEMGPIASGMGLILYYYLEDESGQYSLEELRSIQDWIVKLQLQAVPGVTEVLGIGGFEKQFHVNLNPISLLRYDMTIHDVIERIEANNINVGAQFIEQAGEQLTVRSVGLAENIADLELIVIKAVGGRPVYLSDVAEIEIGGAVRQGLQTLNGGKEVVSGMVVALYGANASTVIEGVEKKLIEVEKALPDGVKIVPYYQQKELVAKAVRTVTAALIQGIALVAVVLLVFMGGFRASVIVGLSIPFSVLFATMAMRYFGISANLMSLGGLAIAIGMMVDGTIVMVENIDRVLRGPDSGESKFEKIGRACGEVARPIVFAIIIIIIVFLPLFTLEGVEGKTFRPLAYTVALAMFGSLGFALLAAPVLGALIMRMPSKSGGKLREPRLIGALLRVYRPLIRLFVRQRWLAIALAAIMIACGALVLPRLGSEFTPRLNEGDLIANLTMAPSVSLAETARLTAIAEKRILGVPEVDMVVSRIGRGEVGAHADPINAVHAMVTLKPKDEWSVNKNQEEIEVAIRDSLANMPGVLANMTQPIQLTVDELVGGVKAELAVKLFGPDLEVLKAKSDEIATVLRGIRGAADVQTEQVIGAPQLVIRPDRKAIARYGLDLGVVQETIRTAIGGTEAGQVFEGTRRFDIYVRFEEEARNTPDKIGRLLIQTPDGARVPLEQIATIKEVVGPRQITRENANRFTTVQANVVDRDIGSFVAEAQSAIDEEVDLPPGYLVGWGGQFELAQAANRRLAFVVPITLLLICLLLYGNFHSIRSCVLILLNIPLALVGGVIALWLSGQNLSVPASVGFIALFGIALENGMVLVTYLNQLLEGGTPVDEASQQGACQRLRPVLMTAATTALGLIPLLLATGTGSEVQRPLATVVIGGLLTSTILTLLVIPALYSWFAVKPQKAEAANGILRP